MKPIALTPRRQYCSIHPAECIERMRLILRHLDQSIMRCLVVADLHYSLPQFTGCSAAPQFDLVFSPACARHRLVVDFRAIVVVK
jgi:hypothetical protein